MTISKYALIAGAGALALSLAAAPASAAPRGAAIAAGVGVGILAGAAIANAQNNYYYSDPYAPAYGPDYYYAPAPAYGYGYYGGNYHSHRWYQGRRDTNAVNNW
jgi:hypothetical protein